MTIDDPSGGSVVLRDVEIGLDTDIGHGFVIDCCRYCEELFTEDEIRTKYKLSADAWAQLAGNEPLQQAVKRQREHRVRSGEAVRDKSQFLFLQAPGVLSEIISSDASPRHKVEAIRELRQCAAVGSEATATAVDRFIIRIDLSGDGKREVLEYNKPLAIGPGHNEEESGKGGEHE
jgi:hypothetical protein